MYRSEDFCLWNWDFRSSDKPTKTVGILSKMYTLTKVTYSDLPRPILHHTSVSGEEFNWSITWVLDLLKNQLPFQFQSPCQLMARTAKEHWWLDDKRMTSFLQSLPDLGMYSALWKLKKLFFFCCYGHAQDQISTCLCWASQPTSRLLLEFRGWFALKCRTPLNSTASWCSSQFLSLPPTADLLLPLRSATERVWASCLASWIGELG